MVCLGNICRSPLAEGILKHKIETDDLDWQVDSAGTSGWHNGERPDPRSIDVARKNGIDITYQRSRQFEISDFESFDLILAMDSSNYSNILALDSENRYSDKVKLLMNFKFPGENRAVPDPYYTGSFQDVFDMIQDAIEAMLFNYGKH